MPAVGFGDQEEPELERPADTGHRRWAVQLPFLPAPPGSGGSAGWWWPPRQRRPSKWSSPNSSVTCGCPCSTRHRGFHTRTARTRLVPAGRFDRAHLSTPPGRSSTRNRTGSGGSPIPRCRSAPNHTRAQANRAAGRTRSSRSGAPPWPSPYGTPRGRRPRPSARHPRPRSRAGGVGAPPGSGRGAGVVEGEGYLVVVSAARSPEMGGSLLATRTTRGGSHPNRSRDRAPILANLVRVMASRPELAV